MSGIRTLLKTIRGVSLTNPVTYMQLSEMIRKLWRDEYGLYNEKFNRTGDVETWLKNVIDESVVFGQALGQDHLIAANQSSAFGRGGKTSAYRETLMGSYPEELTATPDSWVATDRLFSIGNGMDDNNRNDAFRMYKSGYSILDNSLNLGVYAWGENLPLPGSLQYSDSHVQAYQNSAWNRLAYIDSTAENTKIAYYDETTQRLKTSELSYSEIVSNDRLSEIIDDMLEYLENAIVNNRAEATSILAEHDHEIGNQALLFENNLI